MQAAVLGTGIMGAAMARSLAREGHQVRVWNRTGAKAEAVVEGEAAQGITAASSVTDAVAGADVVLTMLFDADSVLSVTDQITAALGPDAVWVQAGTVGPDGARRIAAAAGAAADRLIDAPVLGTRKPAEDGNLVVLASGAPAARAQAQPVFDAVGSRTLVVGDEVGQASALKLACNSWVALVNAGTAQAIALTESQGLDPALFLAAVKGGPVDAPYVHVKGAAMIAQDWGPVSFAVDGVRKDIGLMLDVAAAGGVSADLLSTLLGLYDRTSEQGLGGEDMGAVRTAFDAPRG